MDEYTSLRNQNRDNLDRNALIREYFFAGYTYNEIILILFCTHGITISMRQLNRTLRSLGLRRRKPVDNTVVEAIHHEIHGSGASLGYRMMARRLLSRHGIVTSRQSVSIIQRHIDPEGVAMRRRHQFSRRTYTNKGPNYLIHLDGYDKLKPYGFPIHGAICGFSRRVLWLHVVNSNNDPRIIGSFFLDYIDEIKGVPRCLRIDAGTENTLVEDIQTAFRWDHTDDMSAEKSVIKGSSHSNQRIERWWLSNKQGGVQFWIDLFHDMVVSGLFSTVNDMHKECLRYCFTTLLQHDLDAVRVDWNQHLVRSSTNQDQCPNGKPDLMYYLPGFYGTVDYKIEVQQDDINAVKEEYQIQVPKGSRDDIKEVLDHVMSERGLTMPSTADEALSLYSQLLPALD